MRTGDAVSTPSTAAWLNIAAELIRELSAVFDLPQLPQSLLAPFLGGQKSTDYIVSRLTIA